jgi:hypothetical protein
MFDQCHIGEHCHQATAEEAQMLILARSTTPSVIERRDDVVAIDGGA